MRLQIKTIFSPAGLPFWSVLGAIFLGAALRLFFVLVHPETDFDSFVYGTVAKNILVYRAYALDNPFHFTLVRLPGYPVFLAAIFSVFGIGNYTAIRFLQVLIDLASCVLIAAFLRDHGSRSAARFALWLAVLCPFTANYTALPMTETNSIFCVALAIFASARLICTVRRRGSYTPGYIVLTAAALIGTVLLRPDGVLMPAAIIPGIWWYTRRYESRAGLRAALACALLVGLPAIPWTIRNYSVMHVFQPLAPRFANDPGEPVFPGYVRWTKTWLVDYASSPEVYWRGDDTTIDIHLLPSRAFNSLAEYQETDKLLSDYNDLCAITPEIDARFGLLAQQRISHRPFQYSVVLPLRRLADMWLRPRTEYLINDVNARWWEWRAHPAASLFAMGYGLLNLLLLVLAAIGFARRRLQFAGMLLAYIVLRCLLLMTLENAEPRYTLECFPMLLAAAAVSTAPRGVGFTSQADRADGDPLATF